MELVLDNGVLTLKLDLTRGGAIAYVSKAGSTRSLVNIADEGRYIQQSYYAGKALDRKAAGQSPAWSPWSWNPIQVGDAHRNRAKILKYQRTGDSLYVQCVPMLWDMNNKPAEAEMEQWTTVKGNVIQVRNRITCHRTDDRYGDEVENDQELPAVYPISALKNLYSYRGTTRMALKLGPYFLGFIFPVSIGVRDIFEFVTRFVQVREGFWPPLHGARFAAARPFRD
jgi:hypothetical protein